jgi:hypothetical protein
VAGDFPGACCPARGRSVTVERVVTYYVTFLLDLAGAGENRAIQDSVAYGPMPGIRPKNAFVLKVTCDAAGHVVVQGLQRGKLAVIGRARWDGYALTAFEQRARDTPNGFQWDMIEAAITAEQAQRAEAAPADPGPIEDLAADERGLTARSRDWEKGASAPPPPSPSRPPREAKREGRAGRGVRAIVSLAGGVAMIAVLGVVLVQRPSCRAKDTHRTTVYFDAAIPVTPPPVPPPREVTVEDEVGWATSFDQAVSIALPRMTDSTDEVGRGEALLARYPKAVWADVDVPAETTVPLVLKDPARERGKHLCASGMIQRIERRDVDGRRVYTGRLETADGDAVAFVALGSTGELVKRSTGTLCGVAIGRAGDAAKLLGLFDLPENRTPLVEQ